MKFRHEVINYYKDECVHIELLYVPNIDCYGVKIAESGKYPRKSIGYTKSGAITTFNRAVIKLRKKEYQF